MGIVGVSLIEFMYVIFFACCTAVVMSCGVSCLLSLVGIRLNNKYREKGIQVHLFVGTVQLRGNVVLHIPLFCVLTPLNTSIPL